MRYIRIRKLKKEEKNGIMVLAGILAVSILFSCTTATFATGANFLRLLRQMVIMIIIATGMTFVVSTGEMDISVGAIYNLAVNVMALLTLHTGLSPWLWAPVGILIGAACGGMNGVISTSLGLPAIIITLGTSYVYRGATFVLTGGYSVGNLGKSTFFDFGTGAFLGVNNTVYVALFVVAVSAWWMKRSVVCREFLAIGSNANASRYTGVPVKGRKIQNEVLMGGFAGLAAVLSLAFMASATSEGGSGYEMLAITAVVAGGGSTEGGSASVWGTLGGIALIMIIKNGLMLMGMSTAYQEATEGFLLVFAIAMQRLMHKRTG
ncbi:ABC transporter permease [Lachnospiraceae bacterium]|nr:ABC transporter permease [Lachnospiraceae bacterium]